MIYLVLLFVLLVPAVKIDILGKKGGEKVWYYCCLLSVVLLAGLRYRVGGDTISYMDEFEQLPTLSDLASFDFFRAYYMPGWYVLNAFFRSIDSFLCFQLFVALVVNVAFFRFIRRYSARVFITIVAYYVVFFVFYNMEVMREALCVAIFLEAFWLLDRKKNYWAYFLLCALAMTIHISAVIMLIVPLILLMKKDNFIACSSVCLVMVLALSVVRIDDVIMSVNIKIKGGFGYYVIDRLKYYIGNNPSNVKFMISRYAYALPFLGVMFLRWRYRFDNDNSLGVMAMMIVFFNCLSGSLKLFERCNSYFDMIGLVFIVNTIAKNWRQLADKCFAAVVTLCVILCYIANYAYFYTKGQDHLVAGFRFYNRYVPYSSYLNPQKDADRELYRQLEMNCNNASKDEVRY